MPEKRFALLCQHFYPEMISTGMHMTELARSLKQLGWSMTVYCAQPTLNIEEEPEQVRRELDHEDIKVIRVGAVGSHTRGLLHRLSFATTYLLSTFMAVLRDHEQYDGFLFTTNPPFLGAVGRTLAVLVRKPYILLVYDVYPDLAVQLGIIRARHLVARLWERITRFMLNGADAVVVIGRDMAELVRRKMRPENRSRMHLISNWSNEDSVHPTDRVENPFRRRCQVDGRLLVQYAGRMGTTHNLEPLIEAAWQLRSKPVLFQLIGGGAKSVKLREMAKDRDLTNVQFLPYQPLEELDVVLSAADLSVVCLDSRFTGISVPSKAYGVMASGTPILAFMSKESEISRIVLEHDCGLVLEDPSGGDVADIIIKLSQEHSRLREMGDNGYKAFKDNFTLAQAAAKYDRLMQSCFYGAGDTETDARYIKI